MSGRRHPNLTPAALAESRSDFLACRTLRHGWEPIGAGARRPQFGELVCLRCFRCGSLRYDKFSRITGERIGSPQYDMAPGYRDAEKHSHAWWRAAWAETLGDVVVKAENVTPIRRKRRAS